MKPKSKGVTRLKESLHYATVITLAISNLSVLALAVLFSNSLLGGGMASIYTNTAKAQILEQVVTTRQRLMNSQQQTTVRSHVLPVIDTTDPRERFCNDGADGRNDGYTWCMDNVCTQSNCDAHPLIECFHGIDDVCTAVRAREAAAQASN